MIPLVLTGLGSLAFGLAMAALAGGLATTQDSEGGIPRKVFHSGIFVGAVPPLLLSGFWGVAVYGVAISLIILGVLWGGQGLPFHSALVRDSDPGGPHLSVLAPLASTALGGLASVLLVGHFAAVGFMVCGLGDAAGEAAGRRFGKHRYRIFPWTESAPTRTLEGSLAVFSVGSLGGAVALAMVGASFLQVLVAGLACGGAGALAEALSGRRSDNFWVQLLSSLTAWWIVG